MERPSTELAPTGLPVLDRRYQKTAQFLLSALQPPARILDLGSDNPFSGIMRDMGFQVSNTEGDLDLEMGSVEVEADVATAFEILEHLVAPLNVLRALQAPRLLVTVPLSLWFVRAYRNEKDPWDRHYHEFEEWQFDWLLQKAGWRAVRKERWTSPVGKIGFRPILRTIYPRYLAVEAERL
jgi:methyltransferase family protein